MTAGQIMPASTSPALYVSSLSATDCEQGSPFSTCERYPFVTPSSAPSAARVMPLDCRNVRMFMGIGLDGLNLARKPKVSIRHNDRAGRRFYISGMPTPSHDWYLRDWAKQLGKRRVSLLFSGKQPFSRDILNDVAAYLNIKPHELLLHQEDAMALRRLRGAAAVIAADRAVADDEPVKLSAAK
jgi:hypothetical protein